MKTISLKLLSLLFVFCVFSCGEEKPNPEQEKIKEELLIFDQEQIPEEIPEEKETASNNPQPSSSPRKLQFVGEATRTVYPFNPIRYPFFRIYKLEFYVLDLESFDKKKTLESLKKQQATLIQMTALNTMDEKRGQNLRQSFKEGLERNGVDITQSHIEDFFDYIDVEAKKGEAFFFKGLRSEDMETLEVRAPNKEPLLISKPNIIRDIYSIWLGNTDGNEDLDKLKKEILK